MKTKLYLKTGIILLGICLLASAAGCGTAGTQENNQESQEETGNGMHRQGAGGKNTLTAEELEIYQAADTIEIEVLKQKTDWENKGEILLDQAEDTVTITEGGAYTLSGNLSDGMILINTEEEVKLVLNGVSVTNSDNPAVYVKNAKSCYIETVKGTQNTLVDGSEYETETEEKRKAALFSNDRLILLGEGTLSVTGNYNHAVCSDDEVYVEGGNYELKAVKDGIHTDNWIYIADGTMDITGTDDGLQSEGPITVDGGSITIAAEGKGITAYGDLTVNNGNIVISKCGEGMESKNDLYFNGGTAEITGTDDGLNARTSITINGGTLYADMTTGDGLDSNGSLTITGGLVMAFGAEMPEGGVDCDQNEITITGGTLIAAGGTNSAPSEAQSTQISLLLGGAAKGDKIGIQDKKGNTVFAFEVSKSFSNMILSLGTLTSDTDYSIYTGGTIAGESYYGYYEKGLYEGGTESVSFTTDGMVISAGGTVETMGGPGGGKMPDGQKSGLPENKEIPSEGERPQMPSEGEIPENGELPSGEKPFDAQQQETESGQDIEV